MMDKGTLKGLSIFPGYQAFSGNVWVVALSIDFATIWDAVPVKM